MSDEATLREAYLVWLESHTNRTFDRDNLPADIEYILLPYLIRTDGKDRSVVNQSAGGLTITRSSSDLPTNMLKIIKPYRRPTFA